MPPRELPVGTLDAGSGVENLSAAAPASPASEDDLAQAEARAAGRSRPCATAAPACRRDRRRGRGRCHNRGDGGRASRAKAKTPPPGPQGAGGLGRDGVVCASLAASGYLLEQHREVLTKAAHRRVRRRGP